MPQPTRRKQSSTVGRVLCVADGIILASGLSNCYMGELLDFETKSSDAILRGFIMNLEKTLVRIVLIQGSQTDIFEGQGITKVGHSLKIKVGYHLLGSLITPFGVCLNGEERTLVTTVYNSLPWFDNIDIVVDAPTLLERMPITRPFLTGVSIIDSFLPIGCGQRELIIGDHNTGKTSLALTAVLNQRVVLNGHQRAWRAFESNMKTSRPLLGTYIPCIFVSIGKRRSEVSRIKRILRVHGALKYTCMVFTGADDNAGAQYLAPYVGTAIGEWFRSLSYHALIVYDDLSTHAVAYRQISLLLRRPPGREAYPGDIFYLHSRLLERSAQLQKSLGGGSLTALPIIETKGGDVSGYIPTNVISITDGQIFLSTSITNRGIRPAVDLGLSVSRVGSNAQTSFMKEVSKKAKRDYSIYKRYIRLAKVSTNLGSYIKSCINRGNQLIEFFKQRLFVVLTLPQQIIGLFAICNGYLNSVHLSHLKLYFATLFNHCFPSTEASKTFSNLLTNTDALTGNYGWIRTAVHSKVMSKFSAEFETYFASTIQVD